MNDLPRTTAKAIRYARRLIEFDSASQRSNRLIARYLELKLSKHGFIVERLRYHDGAGVAKYCLVAKKGTGQGGLAWFGHMDTVPANRWFTDRHGPLEPFLARGRLYGRGSCDMKGPIGCFLAAANPLAASALRRPLYAVLTADEEIGYGGARCVVEESVYFREMVQQRVKGVIGEPTSLDVVHAHKGSLLLSIRAKGIAAHSSTVTGRNANWALIPFLAAMHALRHETERDSRWMNREFQPPGLSMNLSIADNSPALNVTASEATCRIYLRPMPGMDMQPLVDRLRGLAESSGLEFEVPRSAPPLYTDPRSAFVQEALRLCGRPQPRTVGYGTDGALLGELADLIVCGPGSISQAHTDDEWVAIDQLHEATLLYGRMIRRWCDVEDPAADA
jgi:acetylornithine deacetylase